MDRGSGVTPVGIRSVARCGLVIDHSDILSITILSNSVPQVILCPSIGIGLLMHRPAEVIRSIHGIANLGLIQCGAVNSVGGHRFVVVN